jgi:hypothetical protein
MFIVLLQLMLVLSLGRIDRFAFLLLIQNSEWIFLIGQLLLYIISSSYQSSYEFDSVGALGLDITSFDLYLASICCKQLFWLVAALLIVSLDALMVPQWLKRWVCFKVFSIDCFQSINLRVFC